MHQLYDIILYYCRIMESLFVCSKSIDSRSQILLFGSRWSWYKLLETYIATLLVVRLPIKILERLPEQ